MQILAILHLVYVAMIYDAEAGSKSQNIIIEVETTGRLVGPYAANTNIDRKRSKRFRGD